MVCVPIRTLLVSWLAAEGPRLFSRAPDLHLTDAGTKKTLFLDDSKNSVICLVPEVGLEPTQPCGHRILNPARLPIPPLRPRQKAQYIQHFLISKRTSAKESELLYGKCTAKPKFLAADLEYSPKTDTRAICRISQGDLR